MRGILSLLSIASLMVTAMHVRAQSYPNQAINLVIPLARGTRPTSPAVRWAKSYPNCSRSLS
jgi:hypothetical protein